jgi:ribosome-associated protein
MPDEEALTINEQLAIPLSEVRYRFSRSSGPGGQHVQKSATRVELLFDVANSPSLTDVQRAKILDRLKGYVDTSGLLHLAAQSERSQLRNREEVTARFQSLVRQALKKRKPRKATQPTKASKERRIRKKRHRGQIKEWRKDVRDFE